MNSLEIEKVMGQIGSLLKLKSNNHLFSRIGAAIGKGKSLRLSKQKYLKSGTISKKHRSYRAMF